MSETIEGGTVTQETIDKMEQQLFDLKRDIAKTRKQMPLEPVSDYTFTLRDGSPVKLSEMFGDKKDLIVIHNMGKECSYCTLWADGLNGLYQHLEDRAGFFVVSPNDPATQTEFANSRGWKFKMASDQGSNFTKDMGFVKDEGYWPGASAFRKNDDGTIARVGRTWFGPGDDFCAAWPLFDLFREGADNWSPKYKY